MSLAGSLQARCNGRPISFTASGGVLTATVSSWSDAWALRRTRISAGLDTLLTRFGLRLDGRIGRGRPRQLLPRPSLGLRLLAPGLRRA